MLVQAGDTDVTTYFHLRLAADGTDATGLTIANIDLTYVRTLEEPATKVDATALADQDTAHTDNYAIEVDGTNMPGVYRIDWPDAAFAAGVAEVILTVKVATAFTETLRVQLVGFDPAVALATQASVDTIDDLLDTELPALTTAVADLPTNAELATALGTADDAVLTAIADLPTNAELATALGTADDAVLAAIAALNNLSAAQVNAEVLDVLNVDTFAEPTGVPGATTTLAGKIGRMYQALRNQVTVTSSKKIFYDDGAAALWEKDLSDNGTTYTETEGNAP